MTVFAFFTYLLTYRVESGHGIFNPTGSQNYFPLKCQPQQLSSSAQAERTSFTGATSAPRRTVQYASSRPPPRSSLAWAWAWTAVAWVWAWAWAGDPAGRGWASAQPAAWARAWVRRRRASSCPGCCPRCPRRRRGAGPRRSSCWRGRTRSWAPRTWAVHRARRRRKGSR